MRLIGVKTAVILGEENCIFVILSILKNNYHNCQKCVGCFLESEVAKELVLVLPGISLFFCLKC